MPVIFCAIDSPDMDRANFLASIASETGCGIKLGLEFFNYNGPQGVSKIVDNNPDLPVFLDLKFHDIPNTVAGAVRSVVRLQPAYINIHASGYIDAMKYARDAANDEAAKLGVEVPGILAVTILTSLDDSALSDLGFDLASDILVPRLAKMAQENGMDGIVCSGHEISKVRKLCGDDFVLMVPGIRPASAGSEAHDQKRVMSPEKAINMGATHLVIGRAITASDNPVSVINDIMNNIENYHES
jgi:orotidine-5'-phosphate decarboxylase